VAASPARPRPPPPRSIVVQIFDRLPATDQRDTVRSLNPGQQLAWVQFCLNRRDDTTWHVIIETVSTSARTYAVRALMSANRMNEPRGPWGAYGVLNGLSDSDQLAVLNQLVEPERRRLQQGLASAPIDRLRLERQLAAVDPEAVPPVRQVHFPLTWVATELPARAVTALGPSAYMGSQGAHSVAPTARASGMRMIGTDYWRALIPARRAVELQRVLNELPRDLGTHFQSQMAATPAGQAPQFPWVNQRVGAMTRPFTVAELQSIPALVAKFNANNASLSAAETTLLSPGGLAARRWGAHRWVTLVVVERPPASRRTGARNLVEQPAVSCPSRLPAPGCPRQRQCERRQHPQPDRCGLIRTRGEPGGGGVSGDR
jgi:hypothetical protein